MWNMQFWNIYETYVYSSETYVKQMFTVLKHKRNIVVQFKNICVQFWNICETYLKHTNIIIWERSDILCYVPKIFARVAQAPYEHMAWQGFNIIVLNSSKETWIVININKVELWSTSENINLTKVCLLLVLQSDYWLTRYRLIEKYTSCAIFMFRLWRVYVDMFYTHQLL